MGNDDDGRVLLGKFITYLIERQMTRPMLVQKRDFRISTKTVQRIERGNPHATWASLDEVRKGLDIKRLSLFRAIVEQDLERLAEWPLEGEYDAAAQRYLFELMNIAPPNPGHREHNDAEGDSRTVRALKTG